MRFIAYLYALRCTSGSILVTYARLSTVDALRSTSLIQEREKKYNFISLSGQLVLIYFCIYFTFAALALLKHPRNSFCLLSEDCAVNNIDLISCCYQLSLSYQLINYYYWIAKKLNAIGNDLFGKQCDIRRNMLTRNPVTSRIINNQADWYEITTA